MALSIEEFVLVYISPSKGNEKISSWENKIRENLGPLSGYVVDLDNGRSVEKVLFDILFIEPKGTTYPNYFNIKDIYLEYIKSLQEKLEKEDNVLKREIETLESKFASSSTVEILIKYGILIGIEFLIPKEKLPKYQETYDNMMGQGVYKGQGNPYKNYWDDVISNLNYIPEKKGFQYKDTKLAVQVLIFSKVKFKLLDITNFVSNVTTNSNIGVGGNFNIQMNLVSQKDIDNETHFQDNNINVSGYKKALFLQSIFRENDLVFIRFEKLKVETFEKEDLNKIKTDYDELVSGREEVNNETKGDKSNKNIRGKYWDMIGLIDSTSINSTYNDIGINISGRDLIKLLIEDYNFFIPLQFANTEETIFGGGGTKIFKRLFASGEYNLEFVKSFKSIENSVGFILSQLTHTEILSPACMDLLKKEYGNDLSKQFEYTQSGIKEKQAVIKGIWGLVNYYVDEKITHLRLADASLKSPDGSVLQQIQKVCQAPFVEIIADTFVDKYNIILRRPPFTMEDISEQKFIVIGKEDTISETLEFNREVYTIYQLNPQGGCFVSNNSFPLAYLPMVILDEYTKMWGNKLYSQVFNYININDYIRTSGKNGKSIKETFVEALIWLIEANAYLPFSRTGTIMIRGDRRIKVGQWIYFEKSNEIFYVDGVQHSIDISGKNLDRKTTLQVSRGLVKDYVSPKRTIVKNGSYTKDIYTKSKSTSYSNVSYGDLVDIDYLREGLRELFVKFNKSFNLQRVKRDVSKDTMVKTDSIVVSEVFDFFLRGAQFEGIVNPYIKNYEYPAVSLDDLKGLRKGNSLDTMEFLIDEAKSSEEENNQESASSKPVSQGKFKKLKGYKQIGEGKYISIYE